MRKPSPDVVGGKLVAELVQTFRRGREDHVGDQIGQEAEFIELLGGMTVPAIVVDIHAVACKPGERLAMIVDRHPAIDDIAVNAVVAQAAIHRLEGLLVLAPLLKDLEAAGRVLLVNPALPAIGQGLGEGSARVPQPGRVEVAVLAISAAVPDRSGRLLHQDAIGGRGEWRPVWSRLLSDHNMTM